jgi:hypothetical protein
MEMNVIFERNKHQRQDRPVQSIPAHQMHHILPAQNSDLIVPPSLKIQQACLPFGGKKEVDDYCELILQQSEESKIDE